MKQVLIVCWLILPIFSSLAQRDLTPGKKRGAAFGAVDFNNYKYSGIQVTGGLIYTKTRSDANNVTQTIVDAADRPIDYTFDPAGKVGFFIEAGMAHFPKKQSQLSKRLKTILVSYYDWGLGLKMINGAENVTANYYNLGGQVISTLNETSDFSNAYLYGRFSAHRNFYLGKKYFIDNGIGINADFRFFSSSTNDATITTFEPLGNHSPVVIQLNYSLGFGIKLSRRSFLIPSIALPIVGLHDWRSGCAALKWYHSNYVPIQAQVKWIYLFKKVQKGCPAVYTTD
jgi:hypothetical protein